RPPAGQATWSRVLRLYPIARSLRGLFRRAAGGFRRTARRQRLSWARSHDLGIIGRLHPPITTRPARRIEMSHSRRTFVKAAAAGAGALVLARPGHAADEAAGDVLSHVGVALYTGRAQLDTKPKETRKAISDMGSLDTEGCAPG